MNIVHIDVFKNILEELRKLPEQCDFITAYGCGNEHPEYEDIDPFGEFADAIWNEDLKDLKDNLVNSFIQLYSMDFQNSYEGLGKKIPAKIRDNGLRYIDIGFKNIINEFMEKYADS